MKISTRLLLDNANQRKEFTNYHVVVYYTVLKSMFERYPWGYHFFRKLAPGERESIRFDKLAKFKRVANKFATVKRSNPIIIYGDYRIPREADAVFLALHAYFDIEEIGVEPSPQRNKHKVYYDDGWLASTYSEAEQAELRKQRDELLRTSA